MNAYKEMNYTEISGRNSVGRHKLYLSGCKWKSVEASCELSIQPIHISFCTSKNCHTTAGHETCQKKTHNTETKQTNTIPQSPKSNAVHNIMK